MSSSVYQIDIATTSNKWSDDEWGKWDKMLSYDPSAYLHSKTIRAALDVEARNLQAVRWLDSRGEIVGIAQVRDVFKSKKFGPIAGCMVVEGSVYRSKKIRVLRENVVIFEGELESLRHFKDETEQVAMGTECGIGVKNYNDVKVGDQIEVFDSKEVAREL